MPDVGDPATPTLTVDPYSGGTNAVLHVTPPPGGTPSDPPTSSTDGGHTWTASVTYDRAGWWLYKWTVTGTGAGIQYQQVYVSGAPPVSDTDPLVCSLEEFKAWIKFGTRETSNDKLLIALSSATEWLVSRIGPLAITQYTERLRANGEYLMQQRHPLVDVTSITPQDGTALPTSAYIVDTTNSFVQLRYSSFGFHTIVYHAGRTKIANRHKLAGMEVGKHLWNVQNGTPARGFTPDEVAPTPMGFAIPIRAEELLNADPDFDTMPGFG